MKLTFLGAAGTVTGSKFLLEADGFRLLLDCGLYQGVKTLRQRNWARLPIAPSEIDAVVLTHAHIDHSGYLPKFVADGFAGHVHASPPTIALARILLPDAGRLQEEDAAYSNRRKISKHHPALPLFDEEAARRALQSLQPLHYDEPMTLGPFEIRLQNAGHILGASSVRVFHRGRSILFSGDLGRSDDVLMYPPELPGSADWIVMESTYGNRLHLDPDPVQTLAQLMQETFGRGGTLLIPTFAVGRAQALLYCLDQIFERSLAPRVPVYMNSPMATQVTNLYREFPSYHRLSEAHYDRVYRLAEYIGSVEESKELSSRHGPMVILSASGMATGGRVLHHLKHLAPNHRNTILFPGFQAPGTRGDALTSGATEIKIHGSYFPVRAKVVQLDGLSAHADQRELLRWAGNCDPNPQEIFVVHGEQVPADHLRRKLGEMGFEARVPGYLDEVTLKV